MSKDCKVTVMKMYRFIIMLCNFPSILECDDL